VSKELHFKWVIQLQSSPEQLWYYVADTDRLNHDIGYSKIERVDEGDITNNRKTAKQVIMGRLEQQWTEEPFEWIRPYRYSTLRDYSKGIFQHIRQRLDMRTMREGGTELTYQLWVLPRYRLLRPFIRSSFQNTQFEDLFRHYDDLAQQRRYDYVVSPFVQDITNYTREGRSRLMQMESKLVEGGADRKIARKLVSYVAEADDMSLNNIKPYALADYWRMPRRQVLETALIATRAGMLDMSWDLLCPSCRSRKDSVKSLRNIGKTVHCDACQIDYTANFEYSVELTFKPNPLIRELDATEFCVGGPGVTPHVLAQQLLQPGESRNVPGPPDVGSFRIRTMTQKGGVQFRVVGRKGKNELKIDAADLTTWANDQSLLHRDNGIITLSNHTDTEQLFLVEHLVWADQAVTAADVTTKQTFRDLFSSEALRPDEQISIGSLTIVFTDLIGSTAMYHEIGDAPAFGRVMDHFDILREHIKEENGTIVKTIGDAVMAVFREPDNAVRAMAQAQRQLDDKGVGLRVGIHNGRCIAVTLNDRLDYFGTAVNMTARLEGFSNGHDVIISDAVYRDPAVMSYLEDTTKLKTESFHARLKGFPEQSYDLWRITHDNLLETANLPQTAQQRS